MCQKLEKNYTMHFIENLEYVLSIFFVDVKGDKLKKAVKGDHTICGTYGHSSWDTIQNPTTANAVGAELIIRSKNFSA